MRGRVKMASTEWQRSHSIQNFSTCPPLVPAAKVDCSIYKDLCEDRQWNATSLPTLKAVRDGEVFDFGDRPRTTQDFVDFMKELAGIDGSYLEADEVPEVGRALCSSTVDVHEYCSLKRGKYEVRPVSVWQT